MQAPQRAWPDSPRVFLIEDDDDSRAMYSEYLISIAGMRVIERASSATALEDVVAAAPDVVVTDYIMPEVDGVTLCQQLRDNTVTHRIPIIMVTADDRAATSDAVRNVCVAVLLKPCDPMRLANEILAARSAASTVLTAAVSICRGRTGRRFACAGLWTSTGHLWCRAKAAALAISRLL